MNIIWSRDKWLGPLTYDHLIYGPRQAVAPLATPYLPMSANLSLRSGRCRTTTAGWPPPWAGGWSRWEVKAALLSPRAEHQPQTGTCARFWLLCCSASAECSGPCHQDLRMLTVDLTLCPPLISVCSTEQKGHPFFTPGETEVGRGEMFCLSPQTSSPLRAGSRNLNISLLQS